MKQLLLCILFFLSAQFSLFAQLLSENFNFSGDLTANGWTAHSGTAFPIATSTGLTYTGYPNSGIGNSALVDDDGEDDNIGFTSTNSGTVYASFLISPSSSHTSSGASNYQIHLGTSSGSSAGTLYARVNIINNGSNFNISFSKLGETASTNSVNYSDGSTLLLVIKYQFFAGSANDVASLFIFNGGSYPTTEPGTADISGSSSQADAVAIASFCLRQNSSANDLRVDGIRVATTWAAALPVEFTTFSSLIRKENNLLSWQTATETNTSHFQIQRSADAQNWQTIGEVKAAGESRETKNYSFTDENPLPISYYRLRSVDFDGAEQFSQVERVERQGATKAPYVLPTNVENETTVVFESELERDANVLIFDMMGRQVFSHAVAIQKGENRQPLDLGSLPKGAYTLQVSGNESAPARFVKM